MSKLTNAQSAKLYELLEIAKQTQELTDDLYRKLIKEVLNA